MPCDIITKDKPKFTLSPTPAEMSSNPKVTTLVLDTGPLLSMAPLHGLAAHFVTVPQILEELKDRKAREHLGKLSLLAGIEVEVRNPDAAALGKGMHVWTVSKL